MGRVTHSMWLGAMLHFFRSEPGAADLRRLARRESARVFSGF